MLAKNDSVAVLISDIHFSVATIEEATQALLQAQDVARSLDIPLIIAGDLLDSKAIIRAECANQLINILSDSEDPKTYILVGNHDMLNEKGDDHALNFLRPYATVVDDVTSVELKGLTVSLIPYQTDHDRLSRLLSYPRHHQLAPTLIMHQGVESAYMGHYQQDKSSLTKEHFAKYRVISGHYHRAQTIECGPVGPGHIGLFSYIGSPYTMSFAEANDGPKGFQVLHRDGSLEHVPTALRKHIILERTYMDVLLAPTEKINAHDLVWLKVTGSYSDLATLNKKEIGETLIGNNNFKFDKIYTDRNPLKIEAGPSQSEHEILDQLIDSLGESATQKKSLKKLWRNIIE